MDNTSIDLEAILKRLDALEKENQELKGEVEVLKNNDNEIKAELNTITRFISAMTESQSIDEIMTEIESAAKQLTDSDSVTFYCMDNVSDKFFSEDGGRVWQNSDTAEDIKHVFDTQEISSRGSTVLIPLVSNDGKSLGVLEAEREAGFDTADLSRNFAKGGAFVENVKLGLEKEYQHQGRITDELTEMYNRQGLNEFLANTVAKAINEGKSVSILMSDIDHFKGVNDTYGHPAGDEILKAVANVYKDFTKDGANNCFRVGGEEMTVILITDTPEEAVDMAEKMRSLVESRKTDITDKNNNPQSINVTVSIGIHEINPTLSITPENARDIFNEEVKEADRALYEAKETGRNKVVSADEHTYMSYLASKAIDVFIESEGLTDINAIDDVSEMIIDTFLNPTEEQDLHTIADALRAYAEQGEGELSETAYFTADKMDELADRLNIPYTEERKIETEEISAGEAEKGISEADRTGNSESKVRSADDLQKQVPEKSEKVKSGKPTLAETLKSIKGWADKVHIAVMEKDKAKEQDKNKNGGER